MKAKLHLYKAGWPVWAFSAAALVFGLVLLIWPGITTALILNICGGALIAAGLYNIARYFLRRDGQYLINWNLALGIALAGGGVSLIVFKELLLSVIPFLFGSALLLCGIIKVQAALNMRRMSARRWYITLILAGISAVLGLIILINPFGTGLMLIRLIGASIAVEAIEDLFSARVYNKTVTTYFTK